MLAKKAAEAEAHTETVAVNASTKWRQCQCTSGEEYEWKRTKDANGWIHYDTQVEKVD